MAPTRQTPVPDRHPETRGEYRPRRRDRYDVGSSHPHSPSPTEVPQQLRYAKISWNLFLPNR